MVTQKTKKILLIIFFVLFMFGGFGSFIYYHENAHVAVFRNYGINSTVNYWDMENFNVFDMTASTYPVGDYYCNPNCVSDQNIVDTFGYQILALVINFWILFTLFIMVLFIR